jgi:hypothetical protein
MGGGGTALPLLTVVVPGKVAREPPELRSCDRSRITLAKAAELEAIGRGRVTSGMFGHSIRIVTGFELGCG